MASIGRTQRGGYQFAFTYDAALLQFAGAVSFTSFPGDPDPGMFETDISVTEATLGQIDFSVISFLSPGALDTLQPAEFTLASIVLTGSAAGLSPLSLNGVMLSDGFGATLSGVILHSTSSVCACLRRRISTPKSPSCSFKTT